jgi:hypothetical protein
MGLKTRLAGYPGGVHTDDVRSGVVTWRICPWSGWIIRRLGRDHERVAGEQERNDMSGQQRFKMISGALALILLGVMVGATLVTPAAAHVGTTVSHLWLHLRPIVRSYGDAVWLGKSKVAAYGAVSDTPIDDFTSSAATTMTSKAFTAPSSGYIVVNGTISAEDDTSLSGQGKLLYYLQLDGTPVTSDIFAYGLGYDAPAERDTGSVGAVLRVTSGPHTVSLQAREYGTGSFVCGRDLSILFVPNGSTVTIPVAPARGTSRGNEP